MGIDRKAERQAGRVSYRGAPPLIYCLSGIIRTVVLYYKQYMYNRHYSYAHTHTIEYV